MNKRTAQTSAKLAMAALAVGYSTALLAESVPNSAPNGALNIAKGQKYFEKICAKCHVDGIGPVITGKEYPEATFIITARMGRNGMPAFRQTDIDDETLLALAKYLAAVSVTLPVKLTGTLPAKLPATPAGKP